MSEATTLATDSTAAAPPRPTRRKWLILALFIVALPLLATAWFLHLSKEQSHVLAAIQAAGGKQFPPYRSRITQIGYVMNVSLGQPLGPTGYDVLLDGPNFDDAWLAAQHDLRSLPIDDLNIRGTRLSRDAIMRLIDRNNLAYVNVPGAPLTDADAKIIGHQKYLSHVNVQQSAITDAGLATLQPARLLSLDVSGTPVTSGAILQILKAGKILHLGVDGRQFTPELATRLAGMAKPPSLHLRGPNVTDTHVELLKGIPGLRWIDLDQTSVSAEAVEALKAAHPQTQIDLHDADTAFYKWHNRE